MAYNLSDTRTISFETNGDLSANQFCFVALDSTARVTPCASATVALGILENSPSAASSGQYAATVAIDGVTRLCVGGAYAIGQMLVPTNNSDGTGIGWAADGTAVKYVRAMQLQASTAAGDVVAVKLIDPSPVTTVVA